MFYFLKADVTTSCFSILSGTWTSLTGFAGDVGVVGVVGVVVSPALCPRMRLDGPDAAVRLRFQASSLKFCYGGKKIANFLIVFYCSLSET